MKITNLLGMVFLVFIVTGCSLKHNFDVKQMSIPKEKIDYKVTNIKVLVAPKNQQDGDIDVINQMFFTDYKISLAKALSSITNNNSKNKIMVESVFLKNDRPAVGATMNVYTDILYKVKDLKGNELFQTIIRTQGVSKWNEAFVAFKRVMLANDRSIQKNISLFLDTLVKKLKHRNLIVKSPIKEKIKPKKSNYYGR